MLKNKYGFVFPLTVIVLFFCSFFLFHQITLYVREKEFFYEQEQIFTLESLLQVATRDLINALEDGEIKPFYQIQYEKGTASYWITEISHDTLYIQLKIETHHQRKHIVRIFYDKEKKAVNEWWEVTQR